ncbi:ribonuclease H [Salarchaeum sp. JOR-1]|uniref:ribonuclease H n=1 Tax=Salarchaeum sp. JOR-1 TaxID=2599399 RepID=UPI0011989314|nr:ribonuclease H [Salarchaeum sp. JOR-1]QDX41761.1 ribonuclease H [Salarchaeum sp. JOR-1]
MAHAGRSSLRTLFDDAPTPHIAHPPHTHHRDFYVATDGSYVDGTGGLGVIIESRSGERVARLAVPDRVPDNNVAEYRALHLGLDVLAARAPRDARVGVLVDHDEVAANVNLAALAANGPDYRPLRDVSVPSTVGHHWRGIRARVASFTELRAAALPSGRNPAHVLANAPNEYAHVNDEPPKCLLPGLDEPEPQIPPPSRANR